MSNTMLVEVALSFAVLCGRKHAVRFRTPVLQPFGSGFLIVPPPRSPLTRNPKIYNVAHLEPNSHPK